MQNHKPIMVIFKILIITYSSILIIACSTPLKYRVENKSDKSTSTKPIVRNITFSGMEWYVRDSNLEKQGPGNNLFSNSKKNVWVDSNGRLHLKITQDKGEWYCAEVSLQNPLGYGKYTFFISSDLGTLDKNVVAGMFTYLNDKEEIDVEFSKWSDNKNINAQFVVQPAEREGNIERFNVPGKVDFSKHSFEWRENFIFFESFGIVKDTAHLLHSWKYTGSDIPKENLEKLKLNLWLNKGLAPETSKGTIISIDSVTYTP